MGYHFIKVCHGEYQNRFEDVLQTFITQLSEDIWISPAKTTWKRFNVRYKRVSGPQGGHKEKEIGLGIVAIQREREKLLKVIVLVVEEMEEGKRLKGRKEI